MYAEHRLETNHKSPSTVTHRTQCVHLSEGVEIHLCVALAMRKRLLDTYMSRAKALATAMLGHLHIRS